jgi:hypothetical protein
VLWSGQRLADRPGRARGGKELTWPCWLFGAPYLTGSWVPAGPAPLPPWWRVRVPLHLVHPLLVHVVLVGAAYR